MSDEQPAPDGVETTAGEDDNPETSATGVAEEGYFPEKAAAEPHGEYAATVEGDQGDGLGGYTEMDAAADGELPDAPEPGDTADTAEYAGGGQPEEPVAPEAE